MTPTLILILFACILVVLLTPLLWSVTVDYIVPLMGALFRRHVRFTWPQLLSTIADDDDLDQGVVPPAVATFTASEQPIVKPNNEYSSGLSDSGRSDFETTAKTIAVLYEKGLVTNLSKAICGAYNCSVQAASKTDSTYQMGLKAVNRHLSKGKGAQFVQADGTLGPATYPITGNKA